LESSKGTCFESSCCDSLIVAFLIPFQLWALTYVMVALALETHGLFLTGAFFISHAILILSVIITLFIIVALSSS
jgi:thiol:disulfide interchange protein